MAYASSNLPNYGLPDLRSKDGLEEAASKEELRFVPSNAPVFSHDGIKPVEALDNQFGVKHDVRVELTDPRYVETSDPGPQLLDDLKDIHDSFVSDINSLSEMAEKAYLTRSELVALSNDLESTFNAVREKIEPFYHTLEILRENFNYSPGSEARNRASSAIAASPSSEKWSNVKSVYFDGRSPFSVDINVMVELGSHNNSILSVDRLEGPMYTSVDGFTGILKEVYKTSPFSERKSDVILKDLFEIALSKDNPMEANRAKYILLGFFEDCAYSKFTDSFNRGNFYDAAKAMSAISKIDKIKSDLVHKYNPQMDPIQTRSEIS